MFEPIDRASLLPIPGSAGEHARLDFKSKATQDRFEAAKDVAAFANSDGGTLLIGASSKGEFLKAYLPMSEDDASATQRLFDEAVRDRCRPAPVFTVTRIERDDGFVVAVNVWPFAGQPVGVELKKADLGRQLEGVFVYPIRAGTHTKMILPEQMPMFIDSKFRRVAFVLRQAVGSRISILGRQTTSAWFATADVVTLNELSNTLQILLDVGESKVPFVLPIDLIEMAWIDRERVKISIPGYIATMQKLPHSDSELDEEEALFFPFDRPRSGERAPREMRVRVTHFPHAMTAVGQLRRTLKQILRRP